MTVRTITLPLKLIVAADNNIEVTGSFGYDTEQPYAVEVSFSYSGQPETVDWVFGRDLLWAGCHRESGSGDVKIWPCELHSPHLYISLSSPEGEALLEIGREDLQHWLEDTFELVPRGGEEDFMDMDGLVSQLLAD